jgi:hypothetical protein
VVRRKSKLWLKNYKVLMLIFYMCLGNMGLLSFFLSPTNEYEAFLENSMASKFNVTAETGDLAWSEDLYV